MAARQRPEGMTLVLGGRREVARPSSARLAQELKRLSPRARSGFACLTGPDGSYVQTGGGRVWFLLEHRDAASGLHLRAHLARPRVPFEDGTTLSFGAGRVALRADEWIHRDEVLAVFDAFLHRRTFPGEVRWRDVSRMLGSPGDVGDDRRPG